jgi:hypothetical protein
MPNYFKPMRRKIGVLTLLMVCVLSVGWIRSFANYDFFSIQTRPVENVIISMRGFIAWNRDVVDPHKWFRGNDLFTCDCAPFNTWPPGDTIDQMQLTHEFKFGDFHFGSGRRFGGGGRLNMTDGVLEYFPRELRETEADTVGVSAPYWSIVIPLTLVSAWLLLSKPRQLKEKPLS